MHDLDLTSAEVSHGHVTQPPLDDASTSYAAHFDDDVDDCVEGNTMNAPVTAAMRSQSLDRNVSILGNIRDAPGVAVRYGSVTKRRSYNNRNHASPVFSTPQATPITMSRAVDFSTPLNQPMNNNNSMYRG